MSEPSWLTKAAEPSGLGANAPLADVLNAPPVLAHFQKVLDELAKTATGSANRIARLCLLSEAPTIDRGEITDESIAILRKAWTGEPVEYESARFKARGIQVLPRPAREDGIPIWAGGNAKRAIRRAVEACEGWCPFPVEGIVTRTARTD